MLTELFHEAMIELGWRGRLNPAALNWSMAPYFSNVRAAAENTIASARMLYPKLPPIHFDFADSELINAVAFLHRGHRFIGVTTSAVVGMELLFERMLSDRRILPHIGDSSVCIEHLPLTLPSMSPVPPVISALFQDNRLHGPTAPPVGTRNEYCLVLASMAFMFLFFHELAHIMNGHIDYLESKHKLPVIAEFGMTFTDIAESIERQALENDADCTAASHAADRISRYMNNRQFGDTEHLQTYEEILFASFFAIFSFFRMFGDYHIAGTDLFSSKHPPLRLRVANVWTSIMTISVDRDGMSFDAVAKIMMDAGFEVEHAFHLITGDPMTGYSRYLEVLSQEMEYHRSTLKKLWEEGLRNELLANGYARPMMYG